MFCNVIKKTIIYLLYYVTVHTGIQEQGDEDCDKRGIYGEWQTEETQEHR